MTEAQYNSAIAIYNPNGGHRVGKIYDIRDTDNTTPYDLTVTGGGGTRINKEDNVENIVYNKFTTTTDFTANVGGSTQTSGHSAPDGSNTAQLTLINANTYFTFRYLAYATGDGGNLSVYAKYYQGSGLLKLELTNDTAEFDLINGVIASQTLNPTYLSNPIITSVGNGWYRCSVEKKTGTGDADIRITMNGASGDGAYFWGRQYVENITELKPLQLAGVGGYPKIDYSTGKAAFLIEPTRTNYETYSYNLITNTTWSAPTSGGTLLLNETGITGETNTAVTLTDTSTTDYTQISKVLTSVTTGDYRLSVWVKKDDIESRFPEFFIQFRINSVNTSSLLHLNTKTGAAAIRSPEIYDQLEYHILDRGDWWEIVWLAPNTDRLVTFVIRPTFSNTLGGTVVNSLTGSIIIGHIGIYNSNVVNETPIITNGAAVTRTANYYYNLDLPDMRNTSVLVDFNIQDYQGNALESIVTLGAKSDPHRYKVALYKKSNAGEFQLYIRRDNTNIHSADFTHTQGRMRTAIILTSGAYRVVVNGVVKASLSTVSVGLPLETVVFGNGNEQASVTPQYYSANRQVNCSFNEMRLLEAMTEQEAIELTTL